VSEPDRSALDGARFETALRDGTPVLIRPVRPEDKGLLREGLARLSEESRYRRFMAPVNQLSEEQLTYLTEVDYVNHFAWVAVKADDPREGLGVARYVRLADEPEVAEAAVTVLDEHQGHGLGTVLLGLLAATAREAGVRTFRAYVLEENAPMRALLEQLGAHTEFDSAGLLRMDVELDPGVLPDSPAAKILKAIAEGVVRAFPRLTAALAAGNLSAAAASAATVPGVTQDAASSAAEETDAGTGEGA
jgi:RimJ/RimL family protein N-acetyltransferase